MTRKDFELIAEVFRVNQPNWDEVLNWPNPDWYKARVWRAMRDDMVAQLKTTNKNFNEVRFRVACRKKG